MSKISDVLVNSVNLDETDVVLDECLSKSEKFDPPDNDAGSMFSWQLPGKSMISIAGNEVVDHPSHYVGKNGIEAIDVIDAYDLNFNMGSALKYILRCGKKDDEIIELERQSGILSMKSSCENEKRNGRKMDNDVKIARFYDPDKMRKAIMYAEQFWVLSQDRNLDEKNRICAKRLHEHYKRLALCIMAKEFLEDFKTDLVVDAEYMKNMYSGYSS